MNSFTSCIKIEVPEPPSDQPESFCRFCYFSEDLQSIFPTNGDPVQRILDLLEQLAGIRLTVGEDFPSAICRLCCYKLEEFDHFRQKSKIYSDVIKRTRMGSIEDSSITIKYENFAEHDNDPVKLEHGKDKCEDIEEPLGLLIEETSSTEVIDRGSKTDSDPNNDANKGSNGTVVTSDRELKIKKSARKPGSTMKNPKKCLELKAKNTERKRKQQDYQCKVCKHFFTDKPSIKSHMKKHIDDVNIRCRNCQKTTKTLAGLMVHVFKSYIMTSFPCEHCDVYFVSKKKLLAHELYCERNASKYQVVKNTTKDQQCPVCPKSFGTNLKLQKHMAIHKTKFDCSKCGADFRSSTDLRNHEERYHSQGTAQQIASTVTCEPCQRIFVDASAYRSHHTRCHEFDGDQTSRQLDKEKLYECDHCNKKFWSINTIRYHMLVHRQFRDCDQCSESFRSDKELKKHKLKLHPVNCEFCPRKYSSKKACRTHCNVTHGMLQIKQKTKNNSIKYEWRKLSFKCASCEQDYEKFQHLKDHYTRLHPGVKVLIRCSYCNMNSQSRIGYIGHLTADCGQTPKRLLPYN